MVDDYVIFSNEFRQVHLAYLEHGPSRFKLVTSRTCFALGLTSPLVGRSKRLRRRQASHIKLK